MDAVRARWCGWRRRAIRREHPTLPRVLGGISPIDPAFMTLHEGARRARRGGRRRRARLSARLEPLADPRVARQARRDPRRDRRCPIWVSEVGVSTFGAEEVQEFGLRRTAELLVGRVPRIHWYSLYDLPRAWPATTRHREAEGSSYYRHFYMGLLREDGTPKRAHARTSRATRRRSASASGSISRTTGSTRPCAWLKRARRAASAHGPELGRQSPPRRRCLVRSPDGARSADFDVTLTFCFTPESQSEGVEPHHTSPPRDPEEFAEFCARMVRRYAPAPALQAVSLQQG